MPSLNSLADGPRVVMYDPASFIPYYVDALCRSLSDLGVDVQVIASPPSFESVDPEGYYRLDLFFFPMLRGIGRAMVRRHRVLRRWVKAAAYPFGLVRAWRRLRRGRPGVFHVQWAPVPLLDAVLVRGLKARGWKVVYALHDPLPSPSNLLSFRWRRALLGLADAVVVHTDQQRRELIDAVPEIAERVHVIPHGASKAALPTLEERARCRARLNVEPDRPFLLFFGLIKPYKGLDDLLAAMPNVVARFPRVQLLVVGEPLMSTRGVKRRIDAAGLRDHVSLRPGFVRGPDVPCHFRGADLFVAPYLSAGASGALVMAQSHGLPVIATRVGGLPEFVEADACGFVVPPRSPVALADAICRALADRDALVAMGKRAWRRLAHLNRWEDVAAKTLALYQDVAPTNTSEAEGSARSSLVHR